MLRPGSRSCVLDFWFHVQGCKFSILGPGPFSNYNKCATKLLQSVRENYTPPPSSLFCRKKFYSAKLQLILSCTRSNICISILAGIFWAGSSQSNVEMCVLKNCVFLKDFSKNIMFNKKSYFNGYCVFALSPIDVLLHIHKIIERLRTETQRCLAWSVRLLNNIWKFSFILTTIFIILLRIY